MLSNADRGLRSQVISDDPLLSSLMMEVKQNQIQNDWGMKDQLQKKDSMVCHIDTSIYLYLFWIELKIY